MSDEAAFLQAIRENPDDAATRLVYADWLDERGDPRGEVIRLACRLAELRPGIDSSWLAAAREGRCRPDIRLRSGRTISLRGLRQFLVYGGLLEGLPTTEMNQAIIDRVLQEERGQPPVAEPYLIRPPEKLLEYRGDRPYPFGRPAAIPGVGCVGRFHSSRLARDAGRDFSELVVVWFQDEFALPIATEPWERLVAIDWERHAADYEY